MGQHSNPPLISPEKFQDSFSAMIPLILEEWPEISSKQLLATAGSLEQVIDCIAIATDRTRVLIRRQLQELYQVALLESRKSHSAQWAEQLMQLADEHIPDANLKDAIARLEVQTETLLQQLKQEMLPEMTEKVQKHPIRSLLTAVGVGFVLGLLVGGRRGR